MRIVGLECCRDPRLILAQKLPDGVKNCGLVVLEIEMQDNDRPLLALIFGNSLLDHGAHLLEEIIVKSRLGAGGLGRVRNHDAALAGSWIDIPCQILLDGNWKSRSKSALDPVVPFAFVRIAVMRIQNWLVVIEKVQVLALCKDCRQSEGHEHPCQKCNVFSRAHLGILHCGWLASELFALRVGAVAILPQTRSSCGRWCRKGAFSQPSPAKATRQRKGQEQNQVILLLPEMSNFYCHTDKGRGNSHLMLEERACH